MHRYFLELNSDGTPFNGWQIQDNGSSVQECINKALSTIIGVDTKCVGCGRTDAGVHALQFYAHFDTDVFFKDLRKLKHQLNGLLPYEVAIVDVIETTETNHTRFDATSRTYHYVISKSKNPFLKKYAHTVFLKLDVDAMNIAAKHLLSHDDFATFCKKGSDNKTTICTVSKAKWIETDQLYIFEITANRFLRGMVRAITGTLLKVGEGDISADQFNDVILAKDRQAAAAAIPAHGLFLSGVTYPYIAEHKPFLFFLG